MCTVVRAENNSPETEGKQKKGKEMKESSSSEKKNYLCNSSCIVSSTSQPDLGSIQGLRPDFSFPHPFPSGERKISLSIHIEEVVREYCVEPTLLHLQRRINHLELLCCIAQR